ncbi:RHS repeat-associated core domain-containing protein [Streptomyces canus]|uniref:RHS repeat-associated core domain-containing protein n=1 Tax=Streptomyces canus TaxID=58343 RepID=UPI00358E5B2C
MALTVPVALTPVAAAATGGGLGKPAVAEQRVSKVRKVTGLGDKKARATVAKAKAANAAQSKRAAAEQKASWPTAAEDTAQIPDSGKAKVTAGGLPVTIARSGAKSAASGQARVRVLSHEAAKAAGIKGVLLTADAADPGTAEVSVDYSAFASAYGGGWSGRLRLVQLPACALTTPKKAACRVETPLDSHNDISGQAVSAKVGLAPASTTTATSLLSTSQTAAATSSATVLALTAAAGESASGAGNYAASPLSSSSTWEAGGSSGAFTWSYPLSTPPAAAGPAPSLSLSYDSGSSDGKTASTNNQSTQVGEGFNLTSSYIDRSYGACDNDGQDDKYDQCWKYDNASLVLNGKSSELIKDDTDGKWRLKNDDASTVTHSTGAENGDDDGEYWTVITGDGTKYVFGLNKLTGAGTERTNSVWTVPVYGDDFGDPGYDKGDSFSGRSLTQAWRWNLDYVVDLRGNAMTYWYTAETNYYAKNGAATATTAYTRGGYLSKILYGQNKDTLFSGVTSDKVTFSYDERCTAADCSSLTDSTADNWPDVPFDSVCKQDADCDAKSPSFFTRKRLTGIDTYAWSAASSAFTAVDSWTLTQNFLDGGDLAGDTSDQTLALMSIRHTGKNGTDIALDPVTFDYQMRANRVDSNDDDILPLTRPRIETVTSETGAITTVTLSDPECVRGSNMPAAEDNDTKSCYPTYWHINGAAESLIDWFHKYRVTAVLSSDPTGKNLAVEHAYTYSGPAWHYNDDPITPSDERTWSIWRGYGKVTETTGISGGTQSKTVSLYLQGMNGDKQKNGTTRTASVAGIDFTGLDVADQTDSDPYAGQLRQQITYNGSTPVAVTVNDPWLKKTATQHKSYADIEAYYVRTAKTYTHTYLTATSKWRTSASSTTAFDDYGMPTKVYNEGDTAATGDETCTRTWYARNDTLGINSLVSRTRTVGQPCSVAETSLSLPTSTAARGDVLADTATVYDTTTATTWTASQTPTKGEATWTGRASAYPATATSGERAPSSWQTLSKLTYDTLGRVVTSTDAASNTTTTVYTPTGAGPLTKTKVTNPKSQNVYTYADYARGTPTKVYDANNKITESTYDALGRKTATWLPNRSRSLEQSANYTYAYSVSNDAPSWTSTSTLKADGTYNTTYTVYDSLLRTLQTQSPTPVGGQLLTDTRYDSRGLAYETYADIFDSTATPSGTYTRAEYGEAPKQTKIVFDGAGRPTSSTLLIYGVQKWSTTSSYTGDSSATTAPSGGSAVRTITDVQGRPVERREYASTSPADTGYGATVGAAYTPTAYTYTRDGKQATITGPDSKWTYSYDLFGRQTSSTDPDKGTATTGYTNLDQTSWTKDGAGRVTVYAYDSLGRTTDTWSAASTADLTSTLEEQVDANKLTHYAYDTLAKGQPDSSTRYVGGASASGSAYTKQVTAYDNLYRATTTQVVLPAGDALVKSGAVPSSTLSFSTYYNIDGTQQYTSEPAAGGLTAETIDTEYNGLGLPTAVTGTTGYLLDAGYSATGQTAELTLGTSAAAGIYKAYIKNKYEEGTDRLTESRVTDPTHQLQNLNYTYDDAGNVTAISDATTQSGTVVADNQCFAYDGYRRLTNAWTPSTADCSTSKRTTANLGGASPYWSSYTYTDAGLRKTETTHTTSADTTKTYCYSATKLHQLAATTTGSTCTGVAPTYVYDDTGNTTTRLDGTTSQTLAWDNESRLNKLVEGSSTTGYVYDADGTLLIRRNTAGETVLYLGATEVHLDTSTSTTKYWAQRYYSAGSAVIAVRSNKSGTSTLSYLAADQHGTSSLALDATTQAITKRYTTPFGASRSGGTGTWPDDKSFLGKSADSSSGLTHIGAREYDPVLARFISVDPLLETDKPQTLNGYTYSSNNPATFSDPTGEGLACGDGFDVGCGNGVVTHGDGSLSKNGNPTGGGVAPGWNTGTATYTSIFTNNIVPGLPFQNALANTSITHFSSGQVFDEKRFMAGVAWALGGILRELTKEPEPTVMCTPDHSYCGTIETKGGTFAGGGGLLGGGGLSPRTPDGKFANGEPGTGSPAGKAPRTPDGKFAKRNGERGTDGSLDERTVMDQLELDGAPIIRGQVYARVPGFPLRKYDGAVQIGGRWLGVEVKGGSSPLTPPQRAFDQWLNKPGNTVTITGGPTLEGTFNAWVPH